MSLKSVIIVIIISSFLLPLNSEELSLKNPKIKGPEIEHLQKVLLYYGFELDQSGADGVFGAATEKALKEYQKSLGKKVTGIIDAAELPKDLLWKPKITGPVKEKAKAAANPKNSSITAGGTLITRFGSWPIPSENNMGERFYDFLLSPNERFITAFFYSPNGDQPFGIPFYCIDLLTGKKELYYGLQIAGRSSDNDQAMIAEGKLSIIIKQIYWSTDERLFINLEITEAGKNREDVYYLTVK